MDPDADPDADPDPRIRTSDTGIQWGSGSVPKSSVTFRMLKNRFFHIFNEI
jgi:hypothetical protein